MKLGLKLWSSNDDLMEKAVQLIDEGLFQYIELKPIPNTSAQVFQEYSIPYILHMTTSDRVKVNLADKKLRRDTKRVIISNIDWVNALEARYLVVHPGFGSLNAALELLEEVNDDRILIENMPKIRVTGDEYLGYRIDELKLLIGKKRGFCLDLGHGMKAAFSLRKAHKDYLLELASLRPKVLHLSDGTLDTEKDGHLPLEEGNYDLNFLIQVAKNSSTEYMTLETPRVNVSSLAEDIHNYSVLQKYLKGFH